MPGDRRSLPVREGRAAAAPRRRTRRPRAEREREILAHAREVFCELGYSEGSVAEIARRAGVVEGTVYAYFPSKPELLARVVRDFYEPLIADARSSVAAIRGTENRLRFLIRHHLRVFTRDWRMCRLVTHDLRPQTALYGESALEMNRRYTAVALEVIQEGIASGELRPELQATVLRDLIYGGIEHALWRYTVGSARVDVDELSEQLADTLLVGALARPARAESTVERLERVVEALEDRARGGAQRSESGGDG